MREYLLVLVVAAGVTYLVTPVTRRLAVRIGAMAAVRDRDVHAVPTPRLGGVAMYAGIAAAIFVAERLPHLHSTFTDSSEPIAVLMAGGLVCVLGIVDDVYNIDALTKLAGQILAAGILVLEGVQALWIPEPNGSVFVPGQQLGALVTVIVVVVIINAVNFIDGLDGLAAGVVGLAAAALFAYSYTLSVQHGLDRANPPTLITAVLVGACAGFLPHNFNPARIFMGDSGSMLIGLLLSASVISLTGQLDPNAVSNLELFPTALPVLLPLLVLLVPFLDLMLASRTAQCEGTVTVLAGQAAPAPPAAGDRALAATRRADHVPLYGAVRVVDARRLPGPRTTRHRRHRRRRRAPAAAGERGATHVSAPSCGTTPGPVTDPGAGGGDPRLSPARIALTLAYVGTINAVSVLVCMGVGWAIDQVAGTTPLFIFIGLPFGILGGVVATVRVVRDYLRQ